jgi:hypothetical protein
MTMDEEAKSLEALTVASITAGVIMGYRHGSGGRAPTPAREAAAVAEVLAALAAQRRANAVRLVPAPPGEAVALHRPDGMTCCFNMPRDGGYSSPMCLLERGHAGPCSRSRDDTTYADVIADIRERLGLPRAPTYSSRPTTYPRGQTAGTIPRRPPT